MTIVQIYKLAIKLGIKADPRSDEQIKKILDREKKKYKRLRGIKRDIFDKERLTNPYADTRILFGDANRAVKKILVGIDIGSGEVMLADKLGDIDLIISHHPMGLALAGLDAVMELQADLLASDGVPINIAESLIEQRMSEVARGVAPVNHGRAVDTARILGIPIICAHTPCDNLVYQAMNKKIAQNKNITIVEDVMNLFYRFYEYKEAARFGAGPVIFAGKKEHRTGKICLSEITGGTEGNKEIFKYMAQAGIGTVIGMHMSEPNRKEAEKHHLNVIIAGHVASDSVGVNIFLNALEKKGIQVVTCSGLIRK